MLISTPYSTPLEKKYYLCTTKRNQKNIVSYGKVRKQEQRQPQT